MANYLIWLTHCRNVWKKSTFFFSSWQQAANEWKNLDFAISRVAFLSLCSSFSLYLWPIQCEYLIQNEVQAALSPYSAISCFDKSKNYFEKKLKRNFGISFYDEFTMMIFLKSNKLQQQQQVLRWILWLFRKWFSMWVFHCCVYAYIFFFINFFLPPSLSFCLVLFFVQSTNRQLRWGLFNWYFLIRSSVFV